MKLIDISTKKYPNTFCKVDDEDFEFLNQFNWYAFKSGKSLYALKSERDGDRRFKKLMHRLITNAKPEEIIDHINCDGLDNRRDNIRFCTKAQNVYNTRKKLGASSKFKGVYFHKMAEKFGAAIQFNRKMTHLGLFKNETDAAIAYNDRAKIYFGEFARLNQV